MEPNKKKTGNLEKKSGVRKCWCFVFNAKSHGCNAHAEAEILLVMTYSIHMAFV